MRLELSQIRREGAAFPRALLPYFAPIDVLVRFVEFVQFEVSVEKFMHRILGPRIFIHPECRMDVRPLFVGRMLAQKARRMQILVGEK